MTSGLLAKVTSSLGLGQNIDMGVSKELSSLREVSSISCNTLLDILGSQDTIPGLDVFQGEKGHIYSRLGRNICVFHKKDSVLYIDLDTKKLLQTSNTKQLFYPTSKPSITLSGQRWAPVYLFDADDSTKTESGYVNAKLQQYTIKSTGIGVTNMHNPKLFGNKQVLYMRLQDGSSGYIDVDTREKLLTRQGSWILNIDENVDNDFERRKKVTLSDGFFPYYSDYVDPKTMQELRYTDTLDNKKEFGTAIKNYLSEKTCFHGRILQPGIDKKGKLVMLNSLTKEVLFRSGPKPYIAYTKKRGGITRRLGSRKVCPVVIGFSPYKYETIPYDRYIDTVTLDYIRLRIHNWLTDIMILDIDDKTPPLEYKGSLFQRVEVDERARGINGIDHIPDKTYVYINVATDNIIVVKDGAQNYCIPSSIDKILCGGKVIWYIRRSYIITFSRDTLGINSKWRLRSGPLYIDPDTMQPAQWEGKDIHRINDSDEAYIITVEGDEQFVIAKNTTTDPIARFKNRLLVTLQQLSNR